MTTKETDRHLLEDAARAIGRECEWVNHTHLATSPLYPMVRWEDGIRRDWNPLTDYGDTLRLAVKLKANIRIDDSGACVWLRKGTRSYHEHFSEHDDSFAAMARAMVRAAAELGKEKP